MRVAFLLLLLPTSVLAQGSPLPQTASERGFAIEVMRLFTKDGDEPDLNMGFVSARHRLNESLTLLGDLPFFYGKGPPTPRRTLSGLGDPYAGIELQRPGSIASFELGVRLPLMTDRSGVVFFAPFTDLDRFEGFGRRFLSVWGIAHVRSAPSASGVRTSGRLGFVHQRFVGENAGADPTNNNVVYALVVSGNWTPVWLDLGASGRLDASDMDNGLGPATIHQLGASARLRFGRLMPGVQFRMMLEDEFVGEVFSLGLSLGWQY